MIFITVGCNRNHSTYVVAEVPWPVERHSYLPDPSLSPSLAHIFCGHLASSDHDPSVQQVSGSTFRFHFSLPLSGQGIYHYVISPLSKICPQKFIVGRQSTETRVNLLVPTAPYMSSTATLSHGQSLGLSNKWKSHFFKMKGDIGMA